MRPIHTLVWHCTATPEGKEYTRQQIKDMHLARGFNDIGYHKLVHLDGSVSAGRPESVVGAHVSGHNTGTLGYSYIGGVDAKGKAKDTRTPAQKATMVRLTKEAIAKYKLRAVVGHRDLSPDLDKDGQVEPHEWVKVCPCFSAAPEYAELLKPPVVVPIVDTGPRPIDMTDLPFLPPPDWAPPIPKEKPMNPTTAVVPVKSAWLSKTNLTQVLSFLASVLVIFGIDIPVDVQLAIVAGIQAVQSVVTWVLRSFFTRSVTPTVAGR